MPLFEVPFPFILSAILHELKLPIVLILKSVGSVAVVVFNNPVLFKASSNEP